ncbi:6-bladed beta-propeller [Bacteroides hominis]|uniref:6-bladed beta-propeller n=1 Tax=Bacteroides hominis TaxID=2763023 RepID=UPI0022E2073F|nr:6-bladed beta-propeller [Bacteroides fragilis]MDA1493997.1 6-bladed beta-propeller [Bacteroides fragilis]
MNKNIVLLFCALFFLGACTSRPSSSISVEDDTLSAEETFKDIDLANNLKDCGKPLLLSDIVKDVEYVKLETQDNILVGSINQLKRTEKFVFIYSWHQNHVMMFDTSGKFIRKIGRVGQGPGEIANIHCFTVSDSLVFIYPFGHNGSLIGYDMRDNRFVRRISLKRPAFHSNMIDVMGDCLVYYPGTVPNGNERIFITACVVNGKGETLMEQIPYLPVGGDKSEMNLSSDASWIYQGRSNVYSQINDTIYGITCDSIYPRYHLSLGKYGLPLGRYDVKDLGLKDFIMMQSVCENKECLLFKFSYNKKMWFSRYDKKTEKIDSWEQTPLKGIGWMAIESPGITNDIDGSQSFDGIRYAGENSFYFAITPDNLDQVRRNVTEAKVKFPAKQAELLKLLDEMGEDDNPIIAIYKLKN